MLMPAESCFAWFANASKSWTVRSAAVLAALYSASS